MAVQGPKDSGAGVAWVLGVTASAVSRLTVPMELPWTRYTAKRFSAYVPDMEDRREEGKGRREGGAVRRDWGPG